MVSHLQCNSGKRRSFMSLFSLCTTGLGSHPLPITGLCLHKVTLDHHLDKDMHRFRVRFSRHCIEDSFKLKTSMRIGNLYFPSKCMLPYKHGLPCCAFFISHVLYRVHSRRELRKRLRNMSWNSSSSISYL